MLIDKTTPGRETRSRVASMLNLDMGLILHQGRIEKNTADVGSLVNSLKRVPGKCPGKVKAVGVILTTSSTECRLVN